MTSPASPNDEQIAYWNSPVGDRWAGLQVRIDASFEPVSELVLARAALARGESVLDVGCGAGATTLASAKAVGDEGHVVGVDVSKAMLDVARRRADSKGLENTVLRLADASTHSFASAPFDVVLSRFGVMFFADPRAAFVNLRSALRTNGRMVFACWQPMARNPWFHVPLDAISDLAPPVPPADPHAPGPFAFADADRVRSILADAGFSEVAIESHEASVVVGRSVDEAFDFVSQIGPAARVLADAPPTTKPRMQTNLRAALAKHAGADGIKLGVAVWLVSARR